MFFLTSATPTSPSSELEAGFQPSHTCRKHWNLWQSDNEQHTARAAPLGVRDFKVEFRQSNKYMKVW